MTSDDLLVTGDEDDDEFGMNVMHAGVVFVSVCGTNIFWWNHWGLYDRQQFFTVVTSNKIF